MRPLVLLDQYDSFSHNLAHLVGSLATRPVVFHRCDALTLEDLFALQPAGIVLSPGPGAPGDRGIALDLLRHAPAHLPMLGVCLGHQSLAVALGGNVVRAPVPVHGECHPIAHLGRGLFRGLQSPFQAMRYHSLVVDPDTLPDELLVTARLAEHPNLIMGLEHRHRPWFGVQFHPESFLSEGGPDLIRNFLEIVR